MEYVIEVNLPNVLLNQAEIAAQELELSANDYLQAALREKINRWMRNQNDGETNHSQFDGIPTQAKLPDELLTQSERAAGELGLSVDVFLHQALQEKVNRWTQDVARKNEFDRIAHHLLEERRELYQRLAQ